VLRSRNIDPPARFRECPEFLEREQVKYDDPAPGHWLSYRMSAAVWFQPDLPEVAIPRQMLHEILRLIAELWPPPPQRQRETLNGCIRERPTGVPRPDATENSQISPSIIRMKSPAAIAM
jgi:hypothetical protein